MVLESRPDLREDGTPTPEPADGRDWYFDRKIWDRSGQAGDNLGIQEEEDDDDDGDYDEDGGSRGSGEKSSSDDVEADDWARATRTMSPTKTMRWRGFLRCLRKRAQLASTM